MSVKCVTQDIGISEDSSGNDQDSDDAIIVWLPDNVDRSPEPGTILTSEEQSGRISFGPQIEGDSRLMAKSTDSATSKETTTLNADSENEVEADSSLQSQNGSSTEEEKVIDSSGGDYKMDQKKTTPFRQKAGIYAVDSPSSESLTSETDRAYDEDSKENLIKLNTLVNQHFSAGPFERHADTRCQANGAELGTADIPHCTTKEQAELRYSKCDASKTRDKYDSHMKLESSSSSGAVEENVEVFADNPHNDKTGAPLRPKQQELESSDEVSQSTSTHRSDIFGSNATAEDISDSVILQETRGLNSCLKPSEVSNRWRANGVSFSDQTNVKYFKTEVKNLNSRSKCQGPAVTEQQTQKSSTHHSTSSRSSESIGATTENGTSHAASCEFHHTISGHGDDLSVLDRCKDTNSSIYPPEPLEVKDRDDQESDKTSREETDKASTEGVIDMDIHSNDGLEAQGRKLYTTTEQNAGRRTPKVDVPSASCTAIAFPEITIAVQVNSEHTLKIGLSLSNTCTKHSSTCDKCSDHFRLNSHAGNTNFAYTSSGSKVLSDSQKQNLPMDVQTGLVKDSCGCKTNSVCTTSDANEDIRNVKENQTLNAPQRRELVSDSERNFSTEAELSQDGTGKSGKPVPTIGKICQESQFRCRARAKQPDTDEKIFSCGEKSQSGNSKDGHQLMNSYRYHREQMSRSRLSQEWNQSIYSCLANGMPVTNTSRASHSIQLSDRNQSPKLAKSTNVNIPVLYKRHVSSHFARSLKCKNFPPGLWGLPDETDTEEDNRAILTRETFDDDTGRRMETRARTHVPRVSRISMVDCRMATRMTKVGRSLESVQTVSGKEPAKRTGCPRRRDRTRAGSMVTDAQTDVLNQNRKAPSVGRHKPTCAHVKHETRAVKRNTRKSGGIESRRGLQLKDDYIWRNAKRYTIGHINLLEKHQKRNTVSSWIRNKCNRFRNLFSRLVISGRLSGFLRRIGRQYNRNKEKGETFLAG